MTWFCWAAVVLCVISVTEGYAPANSRVQQQPWWETATIYQIYPRSFQDSDGDGVGDLKGMTQRLPYLKEVGVTATWINPFYKSPLADFGYDISDFRSIDPLYGTMKDFELFISTAHKLGIRFLLDLVPNHSSDEHPWFQKSVKRIDPYTDYYVWNDGLRDPKTNERRPPNNWKSNITGDAWTWNEQRQQYYFHQFVVKQPDFNYRNPSVIKEMDDIIRFWIGKGVDGFRVDAVPFLFEDKLLRNEPALPGTDGATGAELDHIFTQNQPETYELCRHWAELVNDISKADEVPRAFFLEAYADLPTTLRYYGTGDLRLQVPFNFLLLTSADESTRAPALKKLITDYLVNVPKNFPANWVTGNHDRPRIANDYGEEFVDALNILTAFLPGTKFSYYGEEIGMSNTFVRYDQTMDPGGLALGPDAYQEASRDPERTPMQWDGTPSAGFSTNRTTWLPVNPNYWWLNVEVQNKSEISHLKVFQAVVKMRKDPVLMRGETEVLAPNNDTLVVIRTLGGEYYILIINLSSVVVDYTSANFFKPNGFNDNLTVMVSSIQTGIRPGTKVPKDSAILSLRPKAAVLLKRQSS